MKLLFIISLGVALGLALSKHMLPFIKMIFTGIGFTIIGFLAGYYYLLSLVCKKEKM